MRTTHDAISSQQLRCQQANNIISFDKATVMIEEEASIKIAIPGDAKIGIVLFDCIDSYDSSPG